MKYNKNIEIKKEQIEGLKKILRDEELPDEMWEDDGVLFSQTVKFPDGLEMDVVVMGTMYTDGTAYMDYAEAVLFKDGNAIATVKNKETIYGTWDLKDESNGNEYSVVVEREKVKEKAYETIEEMARRLFPDLVMVSGEDMTGAKLVLDEKGTALYREGYSDQGFIYKDTQAYMTSLDEVCYVPEFGFEDYESDLKSLFDDYENGKISKEDLLEGIDECGHNHGYTHQSLLDLCQGQENVAYIVFDTVDWQYPETYFNEMDDTYELDEYEGVLVLTEGMELEAYLYEKYKEDWTQGHISEKRIEKAKKDYEEFLCECDEDEKKPTFEDYIDEYGYDGELYACFDEFCENELEDKEYILSLIDRYKDHYYWVGLMGSLSHESLDAKMLMVEHELKAAIEKSIEKENEKIAGDFDGAKPVRDEVMKRRLAMGLEDGLVGDDEESLLKWCEYFDVKVVRDCDVIQSLDQQIKNSQKLRAVNDSEKEEKENRHKDAER